MIESTDEIYENIAENIRKGITEPWEKAELKIRIVTNCASYTGNYVHSDKQGPIRVSAFDRSLNDDIHKLRELTTTGPHKETEDWHEAVFTLYKDGHYEVRFLPE